MSYHYDVIVIGGGASGMMAAGRAAEVGRRVLLLEKNAVVGKKLAITGGGRCNITNAEVDPRRLLPHYGAAEKFLYSSFAQFGVAETFRFFEGRGLPLVEQAHRRVFPKSEQADDVVRVLVDYLRQGGVEVRTRCAVSRIVADHGTIRGVEVAGEILSATAYVVSTGGRSHPQTGSTGDGFRWLNDLQLPVIEPTPSIVPLAVVDHWVKSLAGLTLPEAKITFYVDGQKQFSKTGRILCTHFGLSGPTILNTAQAVGELLQTGEVTAAIDVYPTRDLGDLDQHIITIFDQNKNRVLKNVLKVIAPTGTAAAILMCLPDLDPDKKVHSISQAERKMIGRILKALPVTISGLMGFDRAVVVDGGLPITAVDGKTFRVRAFTNLYVTGDLLHISRPSGGYSLQLCWTTGFVVGSSV